MNTVTQNIFIAYPSQQVFVLLYNNLYVLKEEKIMHYHVVFINNSSHIKNFSIPITHEEFEKITKKNIQIFLNIVEEIIILPDQ